MVADHNVAVSRRRWSESHVEIARHRPNRAPHVVRKYKSLADIRFQFSVPVAAFVVAEIIVMIAVPIAGLLAIVVVETVVIVMIPVIMVVPIVVVVPVLRTLIAIILIVMVPTVLILRLSQRYAKKQGDEQSCRGSKPASNVHEILPVKVRPIEIQFKAEAKTCAVQL
jgi:hypothetical protein